MFEAIYKFVCPKWGNLTCCSCLGLRLRLNNFLKKRKLYLPADVYHFIKVISCLPAKKRKWNKYLKCLNIIMKQMQFMNFINVFCQILRNLWGTYKEYRNIKTSTHKYFDIQNKSVKTTDFLLPQYLKHIIISSKCELSQKYQKWTWALETFSVLNNNNWPIVVCQ